MLTKSIHNGFWEREVRKVDGKLEVYIKMSSSSTKDIKELVKIADEIRKEYRCDCTLILKKLVDIKAKNDDLTNEGVNIIQNCLYENKGALRSVLKSDDYSR